MVWLVLVLPLLVSVVLMNAVAVDAGPEDVVSEDVVLLFPSGAEDMEACFRDSAAPTPPPIAAAMSRIPPTRSPQKSLGESPHATARVGFFSRCCCGCDVELNSWRGPAWVSMCCCSPTSRSTTVGNASLLRRASGACLVSWIT